MLKNFIIFLFISLSSVLSFSLLCLLLSLSSVFFLSLHLHSYNNQRPTFNNTSANHHRSQQIKSPAKPIDPSKPNYRKTPPITLNKISSQTHKARPITGQTHHLFLLLLRSTLAVGGDRLNFFPSVVVVVVTGEFYTYCDL